MAAVPIRFRCYRCGQLLGGSRSKIGGTVSCPKCSAELIVPDPDAAAPGPPGGAGSVDDAGPSPWLSASSLAPPDPAPSIDTGVPLDFLDIRPEDIRVEPGVRYTPATPIPPAPRPATLVMSADVPPAAAPERFSTFAPPDDTGERSGAVRADPTPVPAGVGAAAPPPVDPILPPILIDAPRVAPARRAPVAVRSRDLVLPRSVVASWSLFVLLALALAFSAGLLAGHYVWKVH